MGIETDLNVSPYFDDANNAIDDNYHRILFRPAVPVQARELTQLQDILQNQVERFGDNIFTAGTIIKGCAFSYDPSYNYVKLLDLRPNDSQPVQPSSYPGMIGHEASSNLYAVCVNYQDGYESQDPDLKTLYFKYINSGTGGQSAFSPGSQITFYQTTDITLALANNGINEYQFANADVTVASVTDAVGKGYAMTVSSGVIFQKGHFVQVPAPETAIISKYSQYPSNVSAGFLISENIVTESQDTNLLDNATGYSNLNAPGAHRLQLLPVLTSYDTASVPANNFFSLVEWEGGNITRSFQETQYSAIGNEMARRTYEESGNYVVKPFAVKMHEANSTHNFAVVSAGLAYIDGHRVETLNNINVPVRKGTDKQTSTYQTLQSAYDNSILVGEYVGTIPTNVGCTISLRDAVGVKISNNQYANGTPAGNEVGTAKALAVQYESGTVGTPTAFWRVYLTDIRMDLGKNFGDIRGIHYNGGTANAFADVARTFDASLNISTVEIDNASNSSLVFSTSKAGMINLTQSSRLPKYIYRTVSNTTIVAASGQSSLITLSNTTIFPYGANTTLSQIQEKSIIIIPTAINGGATYANVTLTKSGNLAIVANSANVTANGTTSFTTEYQVGDFVAAHSTVRRIVNISNNTFMTMDKVYDTANVNASQAKCYPLNVPINIVQRNSKIDITDAAAQNMRITLLASNGAAETLSANIAVSVHHNAKQPSSLDRSLQSNTNIIVKVNTSNNAGNTVGPWCLGVPYAHTLRAVYKSSNTGTFLANVSSGNAYILTTTAGFANGLSITGAGIPAGVTANVVNSTAMIMSSVATATVAVSKVKWAYYSTDDADYVTNFFTLRRGHKDAFFDHSFVQLKNGVSPVTIAKGDLLTFVFDAMKPATSGSGYISADSYDTLITNQTFGYGDIDAHITKSGQELFLRDSVDFRPFAVNTAAYSNSLTTATVNPAYNTVLGDISNNTPTSNTELYLVAPRQNFDYDAYHYVGRVDKLVMNSYGKFQIIEGQPGDNPVPPGDVKGTITISTINIPPYPSYVQSFNTSNVAESYVTTSKIQQNRTYTMKDIAKLDKRVDNLEYYTSLNMLEQKTSKLTIVSDITGGNRFKNGIFVDNFETTDLLDTQNAEFKARLSGSETALVPQYTQDIISLIYANGTGTSANGGIIRLQDNPTNTEVSIISQNLATETTRCAEAHYTYVGTITIPQPHTPAPQPPEPVITWWPPAPPVITPPTPPSPAAPKISSLNVTMFPGSGPQGSDLHWSAIGDGYSSVVVSISGPSLSYSRTLTGIGSFGMIAGGDSVNAALPGSYSISASGTLASGYVTGTESVSGGADIYPVCPPPPPEPPITTLPTVIVANTETIVVPPAQNTTPTVVTVANTTVANTVTTIADVVVQVLANTSVANTVANNVANTVIMDAIVANTTTIDLSGLFKDPITFNWNGATWTVPNFNIDLLTYSTGTPDTMTTTTSSANTSPVVIADTLPGLTAPVEIMVPNSGNPGKRGEDMMNVV